MFCVRGRRPMVVAGGGVEILEASLPGERAWYWFVDRGVEGRPTLLLSPDHVGVEGHLQRIAELGAEPSSGDDGVRSVGSVEFGPRGGVTLEPLDGSGLVASALGELVDIHAAECPPLLRMSRIEVDAYPPLVVRAEKSGMPADGLVSAYGVGAVLRGMRSEEAMGFCFWARDGAMEPGLFLYPRRNPDEVRRCDALLRRIGGALGPAPRWVVGSARLRDEGGVVFQGGRSMPNFLRAMAGWVRGYHRWVPTLGRLVPASIERVVDGEVVQVLERPDEWVGLSHPTSLGESFHGGVR